MSEIVGLLLAVVIATIMVPKFLGVASKSNETSIATATAEQQRLLVAAASIYIKQNNAAVTAVATATTPAVITVAMLKAPAVALLDSSFSSTNPYGQSWEVQVLEPTAGNLRALVLSKGGTPMPDKLAARVASFVGAAGGIIPQNDSGIYPTGTTTAVGAYSGWSVPLTNFSGTSGGHLAALLSFNNGQLTSNYLYRDAVPGQPQLNTMNTPLTFGSGAVQTAGAACAAADLGSMARDNSGRVLMCDGTTYKTQGNDGVPSGMYSFFSSATCPSGWVMADGSSGTLDLRGAFIRGVDAGRGLDPGRTIGSFQQDALQRLTGAFSNMEEPFGWGSGIFYGGSVGQGWYGGTGYPYAPRVMNFDSALIARSANETRPSNVALLPCMKQ